MSSRCATATICNSAFRGCARVVTAYVRAGVHADANGTPLLCAGQELTRESGNADDLLSSTFCSCLPSWECFDDRAATACSLHDSRLARRPPLARLVSPTVRPLTFAPHVAAASTRRTSPRLPCPRLAAAEGFVSANLATGDSVSAQATSFNWKVWRLPARLAAAMDLETDRPRSRGCVRRSRRID